MTKKKILEKVKQSGISFTESIDIISGKLVNEEFKRHEKYNVTKLNYQRSLRILKTYCVSENLRDIVLQINEPQTWMIITEDWCGDSAQNIPYIFKIAELNSLIDLRIISRDENPDIMDLYLTDGKLRSIPKLVALDNQGNELFQWGPRPKPGQVLIENDKKEGLTKEQFLNKLHLWYSDNKGKSLEEEFVQLLNSLVIILNN